MFAARLKMIERIGYYKRKNNLPISDESRERQMVEDKSALTEALGIDREMVLRLYDLILSICYDLETEGNYNLG